MIRALITISFAMLALVTNMIAQQQQPKPAPTLPPGMTGSDPTDPRSKLSAGMFDAGEAVFGLNHLTLFKKPDTFRIGSNFEDPKVIKALADK